MARHFAANFVNLLVLLLVVAGGIVYWGKSEYDRPGPLEQAIFIEVPRGGSFTAVSEDLAKQGAIRSAMVMRLAAKYQEREGDLKFGNYEIPAGATVAEIIDIVTKGGRSSFRYVASYQVRISDARTILSERDAEDGSLTEIVRFQADAEPPEEYARLVAAKTPMALRISVAEGATSWHITESLKKAEFLGGDVEGVPPEGMLAPNTYEVRRGTLVGEVLDQMMEAQQRILAEEWESRADGLPIQSAEEALTLASIIEKETGVAEERAEVAAVFVNRLNKGMKLQMDSTVEYGLTEGKGFLGRGLRRSELSRKTPYNTYIIEGLPPGPIGNPGRDAIRATLNPNTSNNLFFVADGTGGHVFAETLVEHNRNVAAWRKIEAEQRRQQQQGNGG